MQIQNYWNGLRQNIQKHGNHKLDIGKGCIRFDKFDQIPFDLIMELTGKMLVEDWIECYETQK